MEKIWSEITTTTGSFNKLLQWIEEDINAAQDKSLNS